MFACAVALQACFYALVLARGFVAPVVPSPTLATYAIFMGQQPAQCRVAVTEHIGGGSYSVSDSYQNAIEPSTIRAWRVAPAVRATRRTAAGHAPMYARWIGITGPAWSGCMALAPDGKTLRATPTMFAAPPLIGTWPVFIPRSPSPLWLTIDFLVCLALTAAATTAHRRWKHRKDACPKCAYPRTGLPPTAPCPECGTMPTHRPNSVSTRRGPTQADLADALARDRALIADRNARLLQAVDVDQQAAIRAEFFSKRGQLLRENERSLTERLGAAGFVDTCVWDLVNTRAKYTEAIPLLVTCLHEPYHPRIREGIARALTVPEAAGMPTKELLRAIRESVIDEEQEFRWACANALTVTATRDDVPEMRAFLADQRLSHAHGILTMAIKKASRRSAPEE